MKILIIFAVVGIATAQLAHHRPIQVQITEHNPNVNVRPIQIQTQPIEIVHRQQNFDETQQPGQVFPNFPTWNWQNEMPVRRFPEIFEIVDQPQHPIVFPFPIKPEQLPWNGQLPVEQEPGSPRWGINQWWGEQSPEQLPEFEPEQPQWNFPIWNQVRPQPEPLPEPEQPQWRWQPQPEPEQPQWRWQPQPEPEQPQWRWQPQPEPEQPQWRWQPQPEPVPEPEQHIPRLPPWAFPQPLPEPEPEVPRWGNNPRWNQWPQPEPEPVPEQPQWNIPRWNQRPEPEPRPQWPVMRPSPPEPELISPPVERPIRPNFPQQPPMRHPIAPRASWRDGYRDERCPIPDDHEGYPIFLQGNLQWDFFICWGGYAWPFDCPEDTIFRPEVNVCADPAWNPVNMQPYYNTDEVEVAVPYEAEPVAEAESEAE